MWTDLREEVLRYLNEKEQSHAPAVLLKELVWEYGVPVVELFPMEGWVVTSDGAVVQQAGG